MPETEIADVIKLVPEATTIRLELSTVLAVLAKEREVVRDRARN